MEKIEQGKRARNNKKRLHPPNDIAADLLAKRPKSGAGGDIAISNTPSPMTLNSSRPGSVLSLASTGGEISMNGEDPVERQGSTDGSEANTEASGGAGTTPARKLGKSRLGAGGGGRGGASVVRSRKVTGGTSAPLGGRGKMQKSGGTGKKSRSAAASAGAIAGAKAATNAAYSAYGLPPHHLTTPSPAGSPAVAGGSAHSSPRVSPVPMAFVATSLVTTPPTNKGSSKLQSSLTFAKSNS